MLEVQIPHFLMDLDDSKKRLFEDSMNGPTPDVPIQDIFALYRRTKTLLGMYKAFCPRCAYRGVGASQRTHRRLQWRDTV